MEGNTQIEENREALKRILASLVAMAGMAAGASTLPRHLYRAILRLLRPAESAARRLIIAAARGIVVVLPPLRPRKPKPIDPAPMLRRLGIAVTMSREDFARAEAARKAAALRAARPRTISLPLLDALKNPFRIRRRYVPAHAAPRITWLGFDAQRSPLPPPPSPDDPIDAARLGLRLQALGRALDDLTGQAKRFARWRARHDATWARRKEGREAWRPMRAAPLRAGRPPGGRLWRYDPDARRRSNTARSTKSWRTPTRWPSMRWSAHAPTRPDARLAEPRSRKASSNSHGQTIWALGAMSVACNYRCASLAKPAGLAVPSCLAPTENFSSLLTSTPVEVLSPPSLRHCVTASLRR